MDSFLIIYIFQQNRMPTFRSTAISGLKIEKLKGIATKGKCKGNKERGAGMSCMATTICDSKCALTGLTLPLFST